MCRDDLADNINFETFEKLADFNISVRLIFKSWQSTNIETTTIFCCSVVLFRFLQTIPSIVCVSIFFRLISKPHVVTATSSSRLDTRFDLYRTAQELMIVVLLHNFVGQILAREVDEAVRSVTAC